MFVCKGRGLPNNRAPERCSTYICFGLKLSNIRLDWKGFPLTSTLAHYEHLLMRAIKSFITLGPGSIVVDQSTNNTTIEGLKPTTGTCRERERERERERDNDTEIVFYE
jgi:hypothetical protein